MKTTDSFHGNPALKAALMAQLQAHHSHDDIVKGIYWERGKGCAIGCALHSGDHAEYVTRWDIPEALARLADTIFEGLPNAKAKKWVLQFHDAIAVGSDLSRVQWRFMHRILTDDAINPGIFHPLVKDAVGVVADLMRRLADGEEVTNEEGAWAEAAAAVAARAAEAAWEAEAAAGAAEEAAGGAAGAVEVAAAWEAGGARAKAAAMRAAEAYVKMASVLIDLLEAAAPNRRPRLSRPAPAIDRVGQCRRATDSGNNWPRDYGGGDNPMTAGEFRASLGRLNLTQRAAAELLDLSVSRINLFATGKAPVPRPIALLLASMERERKLLAEMEVGSFY